MQIFCLCLLLSTNISTNYIYMFCPFRALACAFWTNGRKTYPPNTGGLFTSFPHAGVDKPLYKYYVLSTILKCTCGAVQPSGTFSIVTMNNCASSHFRTLSCCFLVIHVASSICRVVLVKKPLSSFARIASYLSSFV